MEYLLRFISIHVEKENIFYILSRHFSSKIVAFLKTRMSSTKSMWRVIVILTPLRVLDQHSSLICLFRASNVIRNKRGGRGQPW